MKVSKISKALSMAFIAGMLASCLNEGDESIVLTPKPEPPVGVSTSLISTDYGANITYNGFTLSVPKGAVPQKNNGQNGQVRFSITQIDELPAPLPSNCSQLNSKSAIKAEPMGFTFNSPLTLSLPTSETDLDGLALLRFDEYTETWQNVPFSTISSNGTISISLIELGYFVIVKYDETLPYGGIRIQSRYLDEEYFYYVTLTSTNANDNSAKRIAFSPSGKDLYMANLPIGNYRVAIARERKNSTLDQSTETQYLSYQPTVNVRTKLISGNGGYNTYSGWTDITLGSSVWDNGRPADWGNLTVTYGTGKLQATLTWINSVNSEGTDYDLHLFGPSTHVYFSQKNSGGFELDRDWLTESGNAIENIYSITDEIEHGNYTIKVHHYSGLLNKRYNCRVIVDDVVIKSVSGSISTNKAFDEICTFDL